MTIHTIVRSCGCILSQVQLATLPVLLLYCNTHSAHVAHLLQAMLAGAGTTPNSYRMGYDISIPVYNPLTRSEALTEKAASRYTKCITVCLLKCSSIGLSSIGVVTYPYVSVKGHQWSPLSGPLSEVC